MIIKGDKMKGFRVPPKKDLMRQLQTEVQNLNMAGRVSQMMTQQLMSNVKAMGEDLGNALNQLYELQYKYTAVQKALNLDPEQLNNIANQQRLVDFNEASAKADERDGLEASDTVTDDSTIVITSTATDILGQDRGIFRSRIKLSESGVPALIQALAGKKVGDKVEVKLNDVDHVVELLAITTPKSAPVVIDATATAVQTEAAPH